MNFVLSKLLQSINEHFVCVIDDGVVCFPDGETACKKLKKYKRNFEIKNITAQGNALIVILTDITEQTEKNMVNKYRGESL